MKKRILRYFKHLFITIFLLALLAVGFGYYHGASVHFADHPLIYDINDEGPYVFFKNDSLLQVHYIQGNKVDGFNLDLTEYNVNTEIHLNAFHPIDSSYFDFKIDANILTSRVKYVDNEPILAVSDIEGGYLCFRDFLMINGVIDKKLNWTFGKGHLVLLGDFMDRGWSVNQLLWLIYKLEQDALKHGGKVHFIIGNHELKNMQGDYEASAEKYLAVSHILGKVQNELYNTHSYIGRWLSSKNAVESINGNLFVHGGIHPDVVKTGLSLSEINHIIRSNYYIPYYPKVNKTAEQLLLSNKTGICWYRGYYKDKLSQSQVDEILGYFDAETIIVGHTLQSKVNKTFNGKVIGIDVLHPKDYQKHWPTRKSEGLYIANGKYFRVLNDGRKIEM